jgi:hypothetical protein
MEWSSTSDRLEVRMLEAIANFASIATAFVAVFGYGKYLYDKKSRRDALEAYLATRPDATGALHAIPLSEVMVKLKMTEQQAVEAAFASNRVQVIRINVQDALANAWGIIHAAKAG